MDLSDVQEKHNLIRRLPMKISDKRDFSEYVKGKTFDQILHEGRKEKRGAHHVGSIDAIGTAFVPGTSQRPPHPSTVV